MHVVSPHEIEIDCILECFPCNRCRDRGCVENKCSGKMSSLKNEKTKKYDEYRNYNEIKQKDSITGINNFSAVES